jgi:hypothetical protein
VNKKPSSKILLLITAATLLPLALFLYPTVWVGKEKVQTPISSDLWVLAIDEIDKAWRGNISLSDPLIKENCPHFYREKDDIPSELKSCRSEIFKCFFEGRKTSLKDKKKFHHLSINFKQIASSLEEKQPFVIELNIDENPLLLELNDNCRQVELPQGAYWGNRGVNIEERLWHTSGIRYFIDRFLVRRIDIREWLIAMTAKNKADVKKKGSLERLKNIYLTNTKDSIDYYAPASELLPNEMEDYCSFRRAEVLSSQVRTAITFHHGRETVADIFTRPPSSNSAPHPFGVRKQKSPQFKAERANKLADTDTCRLIFSKECREMSYYSLFPNSMGWSGVSELLGGPAEYVVNKKYPRKNLHPSSYYHSLASTVHQAGRRVFWSGKGHRRIDFNFFTLPFFDKGIDHFDVGFRCMKVRLNE